MQKNFIKIGPRKLSLAPIQMLFFLHKFQIILRKKNVSQKKKKLLKIFLTIFFLLPNFFFIFLESSETHFDLIGAKLNFCRKICQNLKMKILLNDIFLEIRKLFLHTLRIFWNENSNLTTFAGVGRWGRGFN